MLPSLVLVIVWLLSVNYIQIVHPSSTTTCAHQLPGKGRSPLYWIRLKSKSQNLIAILQWLYFPTFPDVHIDNPSLRYSDKLARRILPLSFSITLIHLRPPRSLSTPRTQRTRSVSYGGVECFQRTFSFSEVPTPDSCDPGTRSVFTSPTLGFFSLGNRESLPPLQIWFADAESRSVHALIKGRPYD